MYWVPVLHALLLERGCPSESLEAASAWLVGRKLVPGTVDAVLADIDEAIWVAQLAPAEGSTP